MNHQKLLSIFRRVLSSPTAPFHEYFVRTEIERLLQGCPAVKLSTDPFGNLIARYRAGQATSDWVFGAHMDHPGFVRNPADGQWRFLGGVPARYLELGAARREFGNFAMWDLQDFAVEDGRLVCRACDDLAGCAILVCMLLELQRREALGGVDVVFTRAEEVGFLGAIELGRAWPFDPDAVFVSVETSAAVGGVRMGSGPVVRAGDAVSFFDHEASVLFMEISRGEGIPVQRALLDRGSCEATALQHYGIRSAGLSLLLGNYHNCSPEGEIAAEYVDLGDAKSLVNLLVSLVGSGRTETDSWRFQEQKFEERRLSYAAFCESSGDLFPCNRDGADGRTARSKKV